MYDLPKKRYHGLKITDHVRRNYAEHIRSLKFIVAGFTTPELPSAWDNTAIVDPVTRAVTNRVADVGPGSVWIMCSFRNLPRYRVRYRSSEEHRSQQC